MKSQASMKESCGEKEPMRIRYFSKKFGVYLRDLVKILKEDKGYLRLIIVQMIVSFGAMFSPFFAVYASSKLQVTGSILGYFTVMLLLGGMIASVLLAILGDILGHHISLLIALVCGIGSATIALFCFFSDNRRTVGWSIRSHKGFRWGPV